jgi:hypothetical protein
LWLGGGTLGLLRRTQFSYRLNELVVEAYGNNAQGLADKVVLLARTFGLRVKLSGVKVSIGPDGPLGADVKIDVRYRPLLGLPKHVTLQRKSGQVPLIHSDFDGATGQLVVH